MRESIKIVDQVLKTMPQGPIYVDDPRIVIPPKTAINTPGGGMEGLIYHFKNYMMGHGVSARPKAWSTPPRRRPTAASSGSTW
jgi:NADH-quinone oxidoreductase subunit D